MYQGEMIVHASPLEIRQMVEGDVVILLPDDWKAAKDLVQGFEGVLEVQTYGEALHIIVDDADKRVSQMKKKLRQAKLIHKGVRVAPPRMEEAFISLMRRMEEDRVA
jgi:ABC-type multidrug transport system ATPase subunit